MSKKKDSLKPWLSRPAINRSVTLPLTRPLTQRLSNLNEFHPNELDPYLLFDAQDSMIGTLENPTLDLDPSKPDTLNVITATRAGVATYTDVNGNIATASADTVRVDYTQGAELTPTKFQNFGYTDFSQGWSNTNTTDVAGSGHAGQASRIVTANSNTAKYYISVDSVSAVSYTLSFYIRRISGSGTISGYHGSASNGNQTDITVTSEWTRQQVTVIGDGGNINTGLRIVSSGDQVEIAMPQVEEGTTASSFVANTTGSPKFITGATYGPRVPMILVEPSATNLIAYSEDFENTGWTAQEGITLTSNTTETLSPEGLNNSYKVVSADDTKGFFYGGGYISTTDAATRSIFLKGAEGGETITLKDPSGHGTPSVKTLTTEWVRYEMETTNDGNTYQGIFIDNISVGTIYAWGAQVETGSVATSYIPTSGSTVTRAADDLVISGSDFSDFFNNSEGTIYCEFEYDFEHAYEYIYNIRQGSINEIRTQLIPTNYIRTRYTVAGSHVAQPSPAGVVQGSLNRHAFSYKTNNFRGNVNGGSDDEELSGNASLTPVELQIGGRGGGIFNIKFKRLIYWPYHSDSL